MTVNELKARRDRFLGAGAPLFYHEPLHIVRGEGVWLYDSDGCKYVDMYNNVPCVGHANPRVVAAMHEQGCGSRTWHGSLDSAGRSEGDQ